MSSSGFHHFNWLQIKLEDKQKLVVPVLADRQVSLQTNVYELQPEQSCF